MRQKVTRSSAGMGGDQLGQALRAVPGDVDVRVVDQLERGAQELGEPAAVADWIDERSLGLPHDERPLAEAGQLAGRLECLCDSGGAERLAEVASHAGV